MQHYCETLYFVSVSFKPIQFPELMDFLKAYLNLQVYRINAPCLEDERIRDRFVCQRLI